MRPLVLTLCLLVAAPSVTATEPESAVEEGVEAPAAAVESAPPEATPASDPVATEEVEAPSVPEADVTDAAAAPVAEPVIPLGHQRHLGIGGTVWQELGFGAVLRGRYKWIGIDAAVGWVPRFFVVNEPCTEVFVGGDLRGTFSALGYFYETEEVSHGLRAGAAYDQMFGWGGIVGYQSEVALDEHFVFAVGAGFQVFPDGHAAATRRCEGLCGPGTQPEVLPLMGTLQWYLGMTLFFYPF